MYFEIRAGCHLKNLVVADKDNLSGALDVYFFNANPTSTTVTDNGTLDVDDADLLNIVARVKVVATDYTSFNDNGVAQVEVTKEVQGNNSKSLWAVVVSRDTKTYTVTDALQFKVAFIQE